MSKTYKWSEKSRYGVGRDGSDTYAKAMSREIQAKRATTLRTICILCDKIRLCDNSTGAYICKGGCNA